MKKAVYLALFISVMFFAGAMPAQSDGHWHGGAHRGGWHDWGHGDRGRFYGNVWFGPGWWGPGWGGPYVYPYYNGYYWAPLTQEQAPAYAEPAPRTEKQYYWYFCPEARNYYPYVKKCPKGWLKVVPPSAPSDYEE